MSKEKLKTLIIILLSIVFVSHSIEKNNIIVENKETINSLRHEIVIEKSNSFQTIEALNKMSSHIDTLTDRIRVLREKLQQESNNTYQVTVTMYHPVPAQTDDTPNITADGTKFTINKASEYRYVAASRNLLKRYGGFLNYGDYIFLSAGKKSGIYQVRDTMHPRFINYIDILESPGTPSYRYKNASIKVVKLNKDVCEDSLVLF